MVGIVRDPHVEPASFPREQGWIVCERRMARLRHGLWLLGRYFVSTEAKTAWLLLAVAVALQFTSVYVAVYSNQFDKVLFDAIGAKAAGQLPHLIAMFLIIGAMGAVNGAVSEFIRGLLTIRWRRWLAEDYSGRWLSRERFYAIERGTLVENPDQRISEDVRLFVEGALLLSLGAIQVTTSVISFSVVLWRLSRPIDLSAIGLPVSIPGDMVWFSILYTLAGTYALFRFGQPLVRRTMRQQHYEADFRYQLVQLRRNAEQIALARLAKAEWHRLIALYESVKHNYIALLWVRLIINAATWLFLQAQSIVPILLTLPRYFAGTMTMGDMMQTRSAFQSLSASLSWPIQSYPTVAETLSAINRLHMLDLMIERRAVPGVTLGTSDDAEIRVAGLRLRLPDGRPLAPVGDWRIAHGERWIVRGMSGAGKSTLLRAIAGIWPEGEGTIDLPAGARIMFVPQRAYLGNGTLRSILAFPEPSGHFSAEASARRLAAPRWASSSTAATKRRRGRKRCRRASSSGSPSRASCSTGRPISSSTRRRARWIPARPRRCTACSTICRS